MSTLNPHHQPQLTTKEDQQSTIVFNVLSTAVAADSINQLKVVVQNSSFENNRSVDRANNQRPRQSKSQEKIVRVISIEKLQRQLMSKQGGNGQRTTTPAMGRVRSPPK